MNSTKSKDELLYEVLKHRNNLLAAYVKISPSFFSEPFIFLTPSFEEVGLLGIINPNDLVSSIDRKSEICEFEGYREYQQELHHQILQMSESSSSHSLALLPFLIQGVRRAYALSVFRLEEEGIIAFVFEEFDNDVINLEKLFFASSKDNLTGLFNLHTFYDHTKKNPRPLYLGLFDLNRFKAVNDTYGHSKGDEVLAEIGRRLIAISGPDEIYYHRSGDEFLYLSFVMDHAYQLHQIERIENELESIQIVSGKIDAAFGLVKVDHHSKIPFRGGYDDREELLFADVAMYQAKLAGKRSVILEKDEERTSILAEGPLENTISRLAGALKR